MIWVADAAAGTKVGGLGGVGLAIGGTAIGLSPIVVVAAPAIASGALAFVGWKVAKKLKNQRKK